MIPYILLSLFLLVLACNGQVQPLGTPFKSPVTNAASFSSRVIYTNLTAPRGITADAQGNLLVVERGLGVSAFSLTSDGSGWERTLVVDNANVTHGIQVVEGALYVSTASQVLLYLYDASSRTVSDNPGVLIDELPADGELTTHAILVTDSSILVGSGPLTNIDATARDPSSGRSQIRRFSLSQTTLTGLVGPTTFLSGELVAYGIRNPAAFAYDPDSTSRLLVLENGASIDEVEGLTPEFVNDNPADEVNIVTTLGASYGFPDCATLWNPELLPEYAALNPGDQFSLGLEGGQTDEACQDGINNEAPVLAFQAHSVPLDIKYMPPQPEGTVNIGGIDQSYAGDAFVSFHGSFDREPPTGYGVVRVNAELDAYDFIIQATDITNCPGAGCIRPVGLVWDAVSARLYVTSDASGELFVIENAVV